MSERKLQFSLANLERALDRLDEALAVSADAPLAIDGTIQRFGFAIELTWKTIKRFLEREGIEAATPRDSLKAAFAIGWIDDEPRWLAMMADRNATSHLYSEAEARELYGRIGGHAAAMRAVATLLRRRLDAA